MMALFRRHSSETALVGRRLERIARAVAAPRRHHPARESARGSETPCGERSGPPSAAGGSPRWCHVRLRRGDRFRHSHLRPSIGALIAFAALAAPVSDTDAGAEGAAAPPLSVVLARAGAYVSELQQELSGIALDETIEIRREAAAAEQPAAITIRADLLLARPSGADRYQELREIRAVGDRVLRSAADRLAGLFEGGDMSAVGAATLSTAGHLPRLPARQLYTPMLPLLVLEPDRQRRFRFSMAGDRTLPARFEADSGLFRVTPELAVVAFRETEPGTLLGTSGSGAGVAGRLWIEPRSGAVIIGELRIRGGGAGSRTGAVDAAVHVSFTSEPLLGFLVPVEMREQVSAGRQRYQVWTRYDRPRKFRARPEAWLTPVLR